MDEQETQDDLTDDAKILCILFIHVN